MSACLILLRAAHHADGIEVLERSAAAQYYELVATFPARRGVQARAYAAALAAAAGAEVEDQLPCAGQPALGRPSTGGAAIPQHLFEQSASAPTWLGRVIGRQDRLPVRPSCRPPRVAVPGRALRA